MGNDKYTTLELNEDLAVTFFDYYTFYMNFMCDLFSMVVENKPVKELLDNSLEAIEELELPEQASKKFNDLIAALKKSCKISLSHSLVLSAIKETESLNFYPESDPKSLVSDFEESFLTVYPLAFLQPNSPIKTFEAYEVLIEPLKNVVESMETSTWFSDDLMDKINEEVEVAVDEWQETFIDDEAGEYSVDEYDDLTKRKPIVISQLVQRRPISK